MVKLSNLSFRPNTENVAKAALNRAILGRIPGEHQPGAISMRPTKTKLSEFKKL